MIGEFRPSTFGQAFGASALDTPDPSLEQVRECRRTGWCFLAISDDRLGLGRACAAIHSRGVVPLASATVLKAAKIRSGISSVWLIVLSP